MSLTGLPLLVLVAALAVALPVLTVLSWRWHHRRLRLTRTAAALICGQLMISLVIGLAVNRQQDFFTSWSDLFGTNTPPALPGAGAPARSARPGAVRAADTTPRHGMVFSLRIAGARSHISLPADVYLPPQYTRPGWQHHRFPVIEFLDGFPGNPDRWLSALHLRQVLDTEITAGRMYPTIAVLPQQTLRPLHDTECLNAVHGPQFATYLTHDVHTAVTHRLRALPERTAWGLIGYSTGGYCANNLALQPGHPYAAAASLSGYFHPYLDRSTGNPFDHDPAARHTNDPIWQATHHHVLPAVSFYATCATPDPQPCREARAFAAATRGTSLHTQLLVQPVGGHNMTTWRSVETPVLDWLSAHLSPPTVPHATSSPRHHLVPAEPPAAAYPVRPRSRSAG